MRLSDKEYGTYIVIVQIYQNWKSLSMPYYLLQQVASYNDENKGIQNYLYSGSG